MKKCLLALGLILVSGSAVLARCCDCCDRYDCCNCPPPRPYIIKNHTHHIVHYPQTGISVNIGNNYGPIGRALRRGYYGNHRGGFGASIHVSI